MAKPNSATSVQARFAEERLDIVCRIASIGFWQWDVTTDAIEYSPVAKAILGLPAGTVVTLARLCAMTHPQDRERVASTMRRALRPTLKESVPHTYRIFREDTGKLRWIQANGEAQFAEVNGRQQAVSYVGTLQDVTDKKLAEGKLTESQALQRLVMDSGLMAIWEVDLNHNTIVGSPALNRLCGFPPDANPTLEEFRARYAPGEQERVLHEIEAAHAAGLQQIQTVVHHLLPDGTEKWLLMRAQITPNLNGDGSKALGVLIDVTENQRREDRLATLAHELKHRLLNAYSVMGAIARRSWADTNDPATALMEFQTRLGSMSRVTELLFAHDGTTTTLFELMQAILAPFRSATEDHFALHGEDVTLRRRETDTLAMALHELSTNAVKYGALSTENGVIEISWAVDATGVLLLNWVESGGPSVVPPTRVGFGTKLLTHALNTPPDRIDLRFDPSGVRCTIEMVLGGKGSGPPD